MVCTANDRVSSAGGRQRKRHKSHNPAALKSLSFLAQYFVATVPTKQFSVPTKPFSAFGVDIRKHPACIKLANETAH
jgi:hypothetical protein